MDRSLMLRAVIVAFEPLNETAFDAFLHRMIESYARDLSRVDAEAHDGAREKAAHEINQLLPRGADTENHTVCAIVNAASESVGTIWYGPRRMKERSALFLYDIVIDRVHRRRGYASAAIERLCEEGRVAGVDVVALHVFEDSTAAIALYDRLGFGIERTVPGHVLMVKSL